MPGFWGEFASAPSATAISSDFKELARTFWERGLQRPLSSLILSSAWSPPPLEIVRQSLARMNLVRLKSAARTVIPAYLPIRSFVHRGPQEASSLAWWLSDPRMPWQRRAAYGFGDRELDRAPAADLQSRGSGPASRDGALHRKNRTADAHWHRVLQDRTAA